MHFIFVYFVRSGFRTKIKCILKIQSKSENSQPSAAVQKFHAYERSGVPRIRKFNAYEIFWIYSNYFCVSFPFPFVVPLQKDNFDLLGLLRKIKPATYLPTSTLTFPLLLQKTVMRIEAFNFTTKSGSLHRNASVDENGESKNCAQKQL